MVDREIDTFYLTQIGKLHNKALIVLKTDSFGMYTSGPQPFVYQDPFNFWKYFHGPI